MEKVAKEPKLELVGVMICELCLDGKGGECHVPGCFYWMCDAPSRPLRARVIPLRTVVPKTHLDRAAWRQLERV